MAGISQMCAEPDETLLVQRQFPLNFGLPSA